MIDTAVPRPIAPAPAKPVPATLVYLHPIGLRAAFWDEVLRALPRAQAGAALDLAGHGSRPRPPGPLTLETLAADAWTQLDGRGIDRCILIGCSLGGMVAQAMTLASPHRVSALVLANSSASLPAPVREQLRARAAAAVADVANLNVQTLGRWFAPDFARAHPDRFVRVARWLLATDGQVQAEAWRAIAALEHSERLARLETPTLVLTGSHDGSVPPAAAQALAHQLRAECVVLQGAGHLAPFEKPVAFADSIRGFVRKSVA